MHMIEILIKKVGQAGWVDGQPHAVWSAISQQFSVVNLLACGCNASSPINLALDNSGTLQIHCKGKGAIVTYCQTAATQLSSGACTFMGMIANASAHQ